jgi:hypothetical protein
VGELAKDRAPVGAGLFGETPELGPVLIGEPDLAVLVSPRWLRNAGRSWCHIEAGSIILDAADPR